MFQDPSKRTWKLSSRKPCLGPLEAALIGVSRSHRPLLTHCMLVNDVKYDLKDTGQYIDGRNTSISSRSLSCAELQIIIQHTKYANVATRNWKFENLKVHATTHPSTQPQLNVHIIRLCNRLRRSIMKRCDCRFFEQGLNSKYFRCASNPLSTDKPEYISAWAYLGPFTTTSPQRKQNYQDELLGNSLLWRLLQAYRRSFILSRSWVNGWRKHTQINATSDPPFTYRLSFRSFIDLSLTKKCTCAEAHDSLNSKNIYTREAVRQSQKLITTSCLALMSSVWNYSCYWY